MQRINTRHLFILKLLLFNIVEAGPDDVILFPQMLTYSTMEGSAVPDVNCSCIGCIPGCNVIWSFNGVGIGNTSTLQLSTVHRFSTGTYTCACVNPSTLDMKSVSFDIDVKCKLVLNQNIVIFESFKVH